MSPNQQYQDPNQQPQQPVQYPQSPYDYILNQQLPPPKKSHKKAIILVLVLLLGLGSCGAAWYASGQEKNTPNTPAANTANTQATGTNEWTGKANTYRWSDAQNWSKGTPKNGQSLHINVSKVKQPTSTYGATAVPFEDDIKNLSINKLTIDGKVDSIIVSVEGETLSVTGGVEDAITQTTVGSSTTVPQVSFHNQLIFAGDASLKTSGKNILSFVNDSETAVTLKKSLKITATSTSQIDFSGAIEGTGKLEVSDNAIAKGALVSLRYASPKFKGKVVIGIGDILHVSNYNTTGTVNALGSSSVEVADGGALGLFATQTTNFVLNNDITMAGAGVLSTTANTGDHTGALTACLTNAQQGCDGNVRVTLGGKVRLSGDTQLGASYGGENNEIPTETTVTYSFENEVTGGYQLISVPASQAIIEQK